MELEYVGWLGIRGKVFGEDLSGFCWRGNMEGGLEGVDM